MEFLRKRCHLPGRNTWTAGLAACLGSSTGQMKIMPWASKLTCKNSAKIGVLRSFCWLIQTPKKHWAICRSTTWMQRPRQFCESSLVCPSFPAAAFYSLHGRSRTCEHCRCQHGILHLFPACNVCLMLAAAIWRAPPRSDWRDKDLPIQTSNKFADLTPWRCDFQEHFEDAKLELWSRLKARVKPGMSADVGRTPTTRCKTMKVGRNCCRPT